uniref:T-cell receptor alpha/delta variable 25.0.4 n=1 Tax=Cyprinus carpio carpio TaxID=630221 RepID=A0A9J7Y668_CYPCA
MIHCISVQPEVSGTEGDNITLSCNYSSAVSLQWYRQYPNSAPEFLLIILHRTGKVSQKSKIVEQDPRFSGKVNEKKTHVDLEISSVKVKYSALYYCALDSTVTGNTTTLYKNLTYVNHPVGSLLIIQSVIKTTETHMYEQNGNTILAMSCKMKNKKGLSKNKELKEISIYLNSHEYSVYLFLGASDLMSGQEEEFSTDTIQHAAG